MCNSINFPSEHGHFLSANEPANIFNISSKLSRPHSHRAGVDLDLIFKLYEQNNRIRGGRGSIKARMDFECGVFALHFDRGHAMLQAHLLSRFHEGPCVVSCESCCYLSTTQSIGVCFQRHHMTVEVIH